MARKPKDDTPVGGWETPGVDGRRDPRPAIRYAAGVKYGKWVWKDINDGYEQALEKMRREQNKKKRKVSA